MLRLLHALGCWTQKRAAASRARLGGRAQVAKDDFDARSGAEGCDDLVQPDQAHGHAGDLDALAHLGGVKQPVCSLLRRAWPRAHAGGRGRPGRAGALRGRGRLGRPGRGGARRAQRRRPAPPVPPGAADGRVPAACAGAPGLGGRPAAGAPPGRPAPSPRTRPGKLGCLRQERCRHAGCMARGRRACAMPHVRCAWAWIHARRRRLHALHARCSGHTFTRPAGATAHSPLPGLGPRAPQEEQGRQAQHVEALRARTAEHAEAAALSRRAARRSARCVKALEARARRPPVLGPRSDGARRAAQDQWWRRPRGGRHSSLSWTLLILLALAGCAGIKRCAVSLVRRCAVSLDVSLEPELQIELRAPPRRISHKDRGEQAQVAVLAPPPNDENRAANLPKHPSQVAGPACAADCGQACRSPSCILLRSYLTADDGPLASACSQTDAHKCTSASAVHRTRTAPAGAGRAAGEPGARGRRGLRGAAARRGAPAGGPGTRARRRCAARARQRAGGQGARARAQAASARLVATASQHATHRPAANALARARRGAAAAASAMERASADAGSQAGHLCCIDVKLNASVYGPGCGGGVRRASRMACWDLE